ncbi:MAG TPA: FecR family protein [Bryobacteraceae bacterium]|nr:FecR family protein [Bryobacteraceae bacterium]
MALLLAAMPQVCPAQNADDTAAVLISVSGRVSILRDSNPWALNVGDRIKPRQIILTGPDGLAVFKVSDGSTFEVYPDSRVTFRDNPGDWRDLLELLLGRVKVHIQKSLGGQPNRNKVHSPTAIISVRGTIFDVTVEEGETTLVVVEEGQVAVEHRVLRFSPPKLLGEGEWIRVYKDEPLAQKSIDRGGVVRAALRAVAEALYSTMTRSPRTGAGGGTAPPTTGTGGGGLPGDQDPGTPPVPPADGGSGGSTGTTPPAGPPPPPPM